MGSNFKHCRRDFAYILIYNSCFWHPFFISQGQSSDMSTAEFWLETNNSCSPIRQRKLTYPRQASVHEEVSFETFEPFQKPCCYILLSYHVCVLNLQPFKRLFYLQARVSNSNHSCKDNASGADKMLKSYQFQFSQEQPLQNDDMGNITCTENSKGTIRVCLV